MSDPEYAALARCRWCGGRFVRIYDAHWVCETEACAARQIQHAEHKDDPPTPEQQKFNPASPYLYVPTPFGCEIRESRVPNVLGGGAAGGSKSHTGRMDMYSWSRVIPGYQALLLRRTFPELESTHLSRMAREDKLFGARYIKGDKMIVWPNESFIKAGHCESPSDMSKYLSTEYDHIGFDEGSTFHPDVILEISSRARSANPLVVQRGGAFVRIYSNPGGIGAEFLRDHFIDKTPDHDRFPSYMAEDYAFIGAQVYDNPYLDPAYIRRLKQLPPERQRQLLDGEWGVHLDQFFSNFHKDQHVFACEPD